MTLQAHLDAGATTIARFWRIDRLDGQALGFTDHDREITIEGVAYRPAAGMTASAFNDTTGLQVNEMDVAGVLSAAGIDLAALEAGAFDGARVEYFVANWADTSARATLSIGYIGEITTGPGGFVAAIESVAKATLFEKSVVMSRRCGHAFGEPVDQVSGRGCGLDLSAPTLTATGSVSSVSGDRSFAATGLGAFASGWFSAGALRWTTGANTGRIERVAGHRVAPGVVSIDLAFRQPAAIAAADGFVIVAGCDRSAARCRAFGNYRRFGGFEHMPTENVATKAVGDPSNPEPPREALTRSSAALAGDS